MEDNKPTGYWKEWVNEKWGGTTVFCSECHADAKYEYSYGAYRQVKTPFCPMCGVMMVKKEEADNDHE